MLDATSLDSLALDALATEAAPAAAPPSPGLAVDYVYIVGLYPWQGVSTVAYGAPLMLDGGLVDGLPGAEEQPPGAIAPLLYADRGYLTSPADPVAPRVLFDGRLQGFAVERRLPLSPVDGSRVAGTFGTLALRNDDGALDALPAHYSIAGRRVAVQRLIRGQTLDQAVTLCDGVGVAWEPGDGAMGVTVRDKTALADLPLLPLYGGTGGKDGPADWAGKPIFGCFGVVRWLPLEFYDVAYGLARAHFRAIQAVDGLWDKGGAYAYAGDYPTEAALKAAGLSGGQYATCLVEGLVRAVPAGGTFAGQVTATVRGDADGSYVDGHATIAQRLLEIGGLGGVLAGGAFASMASYLPGSAGFGWTSQVTVADAVSRVMASCAGWWGDDRNGNIVVGRVEEPTTPTLELTAGDIIDLEPAALPASVSPAVWRTTVQYQRCHAVQSRSQLLTTAPEAIKAFAEREYRSAPPLTSTTVLARYPSAPELTIPSGFDDAGPAADLAATLGALYARQRVAFAVKLPLAVAAALYLGRAVKVTWPRHGLAAGKVLRVAGLPEDIGDRTATVLVWG